MSSSYSRKQSAPLGIKILAILAAIFAVFGILGGFGTMASSPFGIIFGPFSILLSVAQLVVAWGLLTLKPWAWTLTLIVFGIDLLVACLNLLLGNFGAIFGIVVSGLLLAYVYSKRDYYR
ncbi:hypothetical protein SAMN05421858_0440 [Haladaptatus litoreus]|uniref:Uncharacterized protein n=1 Tax=Haladaptatus litoreus TaxID=553468 RepID=A0A1N6VQ00_9EURY|nr:hypothetical protein [Haladaptatus litoreus]SIQ79933.1 hypothetical protein SAMN05421858_0440 [Haladaptatus litoreus]